jgi:hypothetical protein
VKRCWCIEVMFKLLKEHFGFGDLVLPGGAESGVLGGVGAVGLRSGGTDPLGQATSGRSSKLEGSSG